MSKKEGGGVPWPSLLSPVVVVGRGGMSKIKKLEKGGDVPCPPFPARCCPAHCPSLSSRRVVAGGGGVGVVVVIVVVDGVGVVGVVVVGGVVVVVVVVVVVMAVAVVVVVVGGVAVAVGCGCGLMDIIAIFGLFG